MTTRPWAPRAQDPRRLGATLLTALLAAGCGRGGGAAPVAQAPASDVTTVPDTTTTSSAVPPRPATDAERAALDGDGSGLVCDALGAGGAEWDYGPVDGSEPRGRLAVDALDALRDALVELNADAAREGATQLPADGWTELVLDPGSSAFVLDVDGAWLGVVRVSGDPGLGVWRHGSADLCNSLFVPDGAAAPAPSTSVPATTVPRPAPVTTAPDGPTVPPSPVPTVEWLPPGEPPPPVAADEEVYVLMVSNQSFVDATVRLTISVDGQQTVDDAFEVRDQHTVTTYLLRGMVPGPHRLDVVSDTGVATTASITAAAGAPRWGYLTYWNDGGDAGRSVQLTESDEVVLLD